MEVGQSTGRKVHTTLVVLQSEVRDKGKRSVTPLAQPESVGLGHTGWL